MAGNCNNSQDEEQTERKYVNNSKEEKEQRNNYRRCHGYKRSLRRWSWSGETDTDQNEMRQLFSTPLMRFQTYWNLERLSVHPPDPQLSVLITYSVDEYSETHLTEVKALKQEFQTNGIHVYFDKDPSTFRDQSRNRHDWIDNCFEKASLIIVCISPAYYQDIKNVESNEADPRNSLLNARYVYNKIRTRYIERKCSDNSFIPVIFENSGATQRHLPDFMKAGFVYKYPADRRDIVDAVKGF